MAKDKTDELRLNFWWCEWTALLVGGRLVLEGVQETVAGPPSVHTPPAWHHIYYYAAFTRLFYLNSLVLKPVVYGYLPPPPPPPLPSVSTRRVFFKPFTTSKKRASPYFNLGF